MATKRIRIEQVLSAWADTFKVLAVLQEEMVKAAENWTMLNHRHDELEPFRKLVASAWEVGASPTLEDRLQNARELEVQAQSGIMEVRAIARKWKEAQS